MNPNFKQLLKNVRCFVFDVDGVLTDGSLIIMPGELYRIMNIRDGFALKEAVNAGFKVVIISGGNSDSVRSRLMNLGINDIYLGVQNKTDKLNEVIVQYELKKEEILYMGDDIPDLDVMKHVGIPCCPSDAAPEISEISIYTSPFNGGCGCVRDIIEQVMRLNGTWPTLKK